MVRRMIGYVVTYVVFGVLIIAPLAALAAGAFQQGWRAFRDVLSDPEALFAIRMTLELALIATVVNTLFGIFAAWLASHQTRGIRWMVRVADWPLAVSPVIAGFALVAVYGPDSPIGAFLEAHGIQVVFAVPGMVLATLFVTFPFVLREVETVLSEKVQDLETAAYTLGASRWKAFWHVTWPEIRGAAITGALLTAARAMGEFGAVVVVSGNIVLATQTATTYIYQAATDNQLAVADTISLLLASLSFCVLLLLEWTKGKRGIRV